MVHLYLYSWSGYLKHKKNRALVIEEQHHSNPPEAFILLTAFLLCL